MRIEFEVLFLNGDQIKKLKRKKLKVFYAIYSEHFLLQSKSINFLIFSVLHIV